MSNIKRNIKNHKKSNKKINKKTTPCNNKKTKNATRKYKKIKGGDDNVCSICLDEMNETTDDIINLTCNHKFHKECLYNYCKHSEKKNDENKNRICNCPLCRRQLDKNDLENLGFYTIDEEQTKKKGIESIISSTTDENERERLIDELYSYPPYLTNERRFKNYINKKLRAPTKLSLDKLKNELTRFMDDLIYELPNEIYDKVLEFELEKMTPQLSRYQFIKTMDSAPISIFGFNRQKKVYFKFNSATDEDDGDMYAASLEQL